MQICIKCLQLYDSKLDLKKCPKLHCNGDVVEIDELMVPAIIKLRQKKYETKFCCQGHIYDVDNHIDTYISFELESYLRLIINNETPPKGWVYEKPCLRPSAVLDQKSYLDYNRSFENDIILNRYKDKYAYITELMNNLYNWLDDLK